MFLGQDSKYNGKFRPADSKNLPKPWFFHQKSSKIIDFSWFSLSELPYSKSQQPTCLPRVQSSFRKPPKGANCPAVSMSAAGIYCRKVLTRKTMKNQWFCLFFIKKSCFSRGSDLQITLTSFWVDSQHSGY